MKKKILIVDDEPALCEAASAFLTDHGYEVSYAMDGREGINAIEKQRPELLLLDINMPNMNGLEVLQELTERFPHLIVVVISGFLDKTTTANVIQFGAAACVDKPFKMEELIERIIKPLIGDSK